MRARTLRVVGSAVANLRAYRRQLLRPRQREFASHEQALRATESYETPEVIEVVSRKTQAFKDSLAAEGSRTVGDRQAQQNLFVLSYPPKDSLHILDLGGACGLGYFQMNHLLPERIGRWHIVETPAMAAVGRELFADDKLRFFARLEDAVSEMGRPDLLVASGVLQCVPDPLGALDELLALDSTYVYVSRTTVTRSVDRPIVTSMTTRLADHGHGPLPADIKDRSIQLAYTILPVASLAARMSRDYEQLFWFDESEPTGISVGRRAVLQSMAGVLLQKKTQAVPPGLGRPAIGES